MSASLPISDLLDRRPNKTPVYEASRRGMVDDGMKHITAFLQRDGVTEVCINRPGELWFETREGWFREEIPELTLEKLETLAKAIANYNFDAIDTKRPMLSATLPDGERIQIVIHPAVEKGTISYTIRRPSFIDLTIDELEEFGTFGKVTAIDNAIYRIWQNDRHEKLDSIDTQARAACDHRRRARIVHDGLPQQGSSAVCPRR